MPNEFNKDSFVQALLRFGYKESTVTSSNLIWPVTGIAIPQYRDVNSADFVQLASTNASDTASGTGMRKVTIRGVDHNWLPATDEVWLNGTTPTTTNYKFSRVIQMWGLRVGSDTNVGSIFCGYGTFTAGVPANILNMIPAGDGQTSHGGGYLPQGLFAVLNFFSFHIGKDGGGQDILGTFSFKYRQIYGQQQGSFELGPWRTRFTGSSIDDLTYNSPSQDAFVMDGPCDIHAEVSGSAVGARANVTVGAELHQKFQNRVPAG